MADSREIALSELIGALSSALDIAEGEPQGHAARSCLIGMRVADEIGLDDAARSDLFYALLLKDAGCSANSAHMAALFGADDQEAKRTSKLVDWARPLSAFVWSLKTVAPDGSLAERTDRLRAIRAEGRVTRSLMKARCHRGAEIAEKLGFSGATAGAIRALDEHWDGHGQPEGLKGTEIPLAARIMCLAQTVDVFNTARGVTVAYRVAAKRNGQWFDPDLVAALGSFRHDRRFWDSLTKPDVSAVEPQDRVLTADEHRLDLIAEGFAAVIDAKSPWTHEHCDRVCAIATGMGTLLGFDEAALRELRRASLLHDIGKLSISNRILDKPGPLTEDERTKFEEHPLLTEQILGRVPSFGGLAALASAHHERLDGHGYPRGLAAEQLTMPMRVLAVADVYEALISERPYRPAFTTDVALDLMSADVPSRLDPDAFAALKKLLDAEGSGGGNVPLIGDKRSLRRIR
ncbi:MAG TPA: HD domain-containing phosphohydrolase [Solirubrobacteraceae bacterium]|jgi:HD-GYP domain-containing protein (c-di-GMP phosphodiesterase class II)